MIHNQYSIQQTVPQPVTAQKHIGTHRRFTACLALILFIAFCSNGICANEKAVVTKDAIQRDIEKNRIQIRRLQKGIREKQDQTEETAKVENNILQELENIDLRLQKQQQKVAELENQVLEQQILINIKQTEITSLQKDRDRVLSHLKKRIGAYYKMGKVGFLNVTFSSKSLPELLKFHDAYQTLIAYDQDVVVQYRYKIDELERARNAYALEKELLQGFITTTRNENRETDLIRDEKEKLLSHVRTQKHLHQQAIQEMEKASEDLSATLISLKSTEQNLEKTFANSKGKLPSPLTGKVITYFNQEKANKLGILRKSTGIAIKAPDGTKVEAIADGAVIFSGYLRGYGNTVIIHHGFQYYSVTSRLEKLQAKEGDSVKSGNIIGYLSDTATLIDDGLYFEIRHGKQSQDPLQWLDTRKLQLTEQQPANEQG
jgi:septal ring factor EnvC (AmiA/AmiB activator)